MFIANITSRVLQSLEFFRSGAGKWGVLFVTKFLQFRLFALPLFIWGAIKLTITGFGLFCSAIRAKLNALSFSGLQVGGVDILALANTVLPIDELMAMIVSWFAVYAICATIRFIRAAWSAIPLKAS